MRDWWLTQAVACPLDQYHEKLSENENICCILLFRNTFDRYEHFSDVFSVNVEEGKSLVIIVSQNLISYDFGTSLYFVLHKVKRTSGGSRW